MKNKDQQVYDVAVAGSGIVGLAMAYHASKRGLKTAVFERNPAASGATVRNFGMIWPFGQPLETFDRAMRSREIWLELSAKAGFWAAETGALCLAYEDDEWSVLEEFYETRCDAGYRIDLLDPVSVSGRSKAVQPNGLKGALWSATEVNIDPREATRKIHRYLRESAGVDFYYNTPINFIDLPWVGNAQNSWQADRVFVCGGADFETLYPEIFAESGITRCKLQMMRTVTQPEGWALGPTLCGGLTLQHYQSFAHCESLDRLKNRYAAELPEYNDWGIHVLVSQTSLGEITLGDSHEYGLDLSPFDRAHINQLILDYLGRFASFPNMEIAETWHGVYPKLKGKTELVTDAEDGVTIVNGLGGAGMTLSFGLAGEIMDKI
ncbi:MAG: TIGR03364 family FAD-dependent oxidoreductase [Lewinellaceae bacterium]|nr:TIGR03364 family FAD-dependent oxidoreductase [Lewinella sp.]MCB9277960.1 TIGR03364 family FAD-dependent oxidoreductase [Lewinellaceae bacterium]